MGLIVARFVGHIKHRDNKMNIARRLPEVSLYSVTVRQTTAKKVKKLLLSFVYPQTQR